GGARSAVRPARHRPVPGREHRGARLPGAAGLCDGGGRVAARPQRRRRALPRLARTAPHMSLARLLPALIVLALMLVGAVWQPYNPDAIDLALRFAPPSFRHWLGTDQLGRDVLARLMVGGWRTAVVLGCVA